MADRIAVPDGWQLVRLGDVAEVNRAQWNPADGPIRYLDLTAVAEPGRLSPAREVAVEEAPSRARRRVCSGDILVSTVRPYLRGFARVPEAPATLVASTGFAVLTPRSEVDRSFVYHHVMTPGFTQHLEANMTGQAYPAVRPDDVVSFQLALPPLPEQRGIAAVLDSIGEAVERTESVIAATEALRDALLHELLTRGVPGQHTAWKDAPSIGTVPADWEVVRLGDVAEVVMGQSPPGATVFEWDSQPARGNGLPFVQGNAEFGARFPRPVKWCIAPVKIAKQGDTLITTKVTGASICITIYNCGRAWMPRIRARDMV